MLSTLISLLLHKFTVWNVEFVPRYLLCSRLRFQNSPMSGLFVAFAALHIPYIHQLFVRVSPRTNQPTSSPFDSRAKYFEVKCFCFQKWIPSTKEICNKSLYNFLLCCNHFLSWLENFQFLDLFASSLHNVV
jgi:hypothetical protein